MKLKTIFIKLYILILCFCFFACNNKKQEKSVVELWYQKEIIIPKHITFKSSGRDTSCPNLLKHKYKVLVYLDSLGCLPCKLKPMSWKAYIDSCSQLKYDIGFLFVVHSNDYSVFEQRLSIFNFNYPVIYDSKNLFNKINNFPKEDIYRTFLLDDKNHVILIGSPINNDKISKLYTEILGNKKILNKDSLKKIYRKSSSIIKTSVQLNKDSVNLGIFSSKTIKHIPFQLKNAGNYPLLIQDVSTSCSCSVAKYEKDLFHNE